MSYDPDNMPALTGSPNQITWAEKIRLTEIPLITRRITDPAAGYPGAVRAMDLDGELAALTGAQFASMAPEAREETALIDVDGFSPAVRSGIASTLVEWALSHTDACWWIDERADITGAALRAFNDAHVQ